MFAFPLANIRFARDGFSHTPPGIRTPPVNTAPAGLLIDPDQATDRALVRRSLMAKHDWIGIVGIATTVLSAGLICVLLFAM